jgi:hypothetical protein
MANVLAENLSTFASSSGGVLYYGVSDSGEVRGMTLTSDTWDSLMKRLQAVIRTCIVTDAPISSLYSFSVEPVFSHAQIDSGYHFAVLGDVAENRFTAGLVPPPRSVFFSDKHDQYVIRMQVAPAGPGVSIPFQGQNKERIDNSKRSFGGAGASASAAPGDGKSSSSSAGVASLKRSAATAATTSAAKEPARAATDRVDGAAPASATTQAQPKKAQGKRKAAAAGAGDRTCAQGVLSEVHPFGGDVELVGSADAAAAAKPSAPHSNANDRAKGSPAKVAASQTKN